MKCKFKDDIGFECKEDALTATNYCILHLPFPDNKGRVYDRILNLKYLKIQEKIKNNDFNFTGAIMHGLNINGREIDANIVFDSANILGNLNFKNNRISGRVGFSNAIIRGNVDFRNSIIENEVNFMLSTLKNGSVFFMDTIIGGKIHFDGANLGGYLDFERSIIHNDANFSFKKVGHDAQFKGITVEGSVNFDNIDVGGYITLEDAEIKGSINFQEALLGTSTSTPDGNGSYFDGLNVNGEADFTGAEFFGETNFLRAYFRENAYFSLAIFNDIVDFEGARFYENADFSLTNFKHQSNFNGATFLSTGTFSGLNGNMKFYSSFQGSRLKNISFRDCDMSNVRFNNVIFENCDLSTSKWQNNEIIEHREYIHKKIENQNLYINPNFLRLSNVLGIIWIPELIQEAKIVADIYRRIRQSLQQQGAYDKAGIFYVKEMDMKKEFYWEENKVLWFIYNILSFTTGYGEKLANIFVIFVIYWIIYIYAVYSMPDNKLVIPLGSGILSVVTALFVYVFARKMAR